MCNTLINNYDVHLKIGDPVYKLFYNDVTFHIEKTKIVNIEKRTRKLSEFFPIDITEIFCICEDGYEFELGDIDTCKRCLLFSSLDKLKNYVKQKIEVSIYLTRMQIEKYQHKLKILENRKKLYEVD